MVNDLEFVPEAWSLKGEELADTTALMFGRRSYEAFAPVWPGSEDHADYQELPKYVVSSTLPDDALVDGWGPTTILRSTEDVAALKQSDGGAIFIHGSAELARRLSDAGLIDQYNLLVFPVLLGAGKSLFGRADRDKHMLTLRESQTYSERDPEADLRRHALTQVEGDRTAGALPQLPGRAPDVAAQRPGQVRLVEVVELGDDLGGRVAGGQQLPPPCGRARSAGRHPG